MPEMGEGIIEAVVAQWLKVEGDRVEQYDPILEIETDKVTTEATAEAAGTLLKIYVEAGETVPVGTVLGFIGEPGEAESEQEPAVAEPVAAAPVAAAPEVGELSRTIEAKAVRTTRLHLRLRQAQAAATSLVTSRLHHLGELIVNVPVACAIRVPSLLTSAAIKAIRLPRRTTWALPVSSPLRTGR